MVDFGSKPDRRSLLGALSLGACAAPEYSYELDRGSAVDPRMKACHGPDQPFLAAFRQCGALERRSGVARAAEQ